VNFTNSLPIQGDGALYIFRVHAGPEDQSIGVFKTKRETFPSWVLPKHPEDSLAQIIPMAATIDSDANDGTAAAGPASASANHYQPLYQEVEEDIFGRPPDRRDHNAAAVLQAIRTIAKEEKRNDQRATFFVLISGRNDQPVFYPLGLIGDGHLASLPLAASSDFIQELPYEHHMTGCVPAQFSKDLLSMVNQCTLLPHPPAISFNDLKRDLVRPHAAQALLLLDHQG